MKKLCIGNWKMNCNKDMLLKFNPNTFMSYENVEVGIAVPHVYIQMAGDRFVEGRPCLCAQDCSGFDSGSHTGEVGARMLKELGVRYVILGHSERRSLLGESNDTVLSKLKLALGAGIEVILCVGETLEQRKNNVTNEVIRSQLDILSEVDGLERINVAYEPVWAIGTGQAASSKDIQSALDQIKNSLSRYTFKSRIIYGGSVKKSNCKEISRIEGLNGFLVGNASLTEEFSSIIKSLV